MCNGGGDSNTKEKNDDTHGMNDTFVEELLAQVSRMQSKGFSNEAIMLALKSLAGDVT